MRGGLATRYAPSFALIRAHFAFGVAGLSILAAALLVRAHAIEGFFFQPLLLGLVHLCVLGWLLPTAIGALHQLVPVVFEVPVRSERLAWTAFATYAAGSATFIVQMWRLDRGPVLAVAATVTAAAVWLYAINLLWTLGKTAQRTLTGAYVLAAIAYLLIAVSVGVSLAWNLAYPYLTVDHIALLRLHAHGAGLGFFGLLIMGVAFRLLEMFLLSHGAKERAGWIAFVATNVAIVLLGVCFMTSSDGVLLAAGVGSAAIGVGAFLVQVRAIWSRRMKKHREVAWTHTVTSFAYLGATTAIGALLAFVPLDPVWWDRWHLAYGLLALPGFIGTIVVGQMYKIAPFLVWLHRFSPYVGLKKVPTAAELLAERPKLVQYWLMHAGLVGMAAGVLLDVALVRTTGAACFAASAALFVRNLAVIDSKRP